MTTSPYHPDLLILQGTCAGLPANNLVDSGASMTIINHRYMAKYKPPKTKEDPRKTPMGVSRLLLPRGPSCGSGITWLLWMLVLRHVQGDKECW